MDRVNLIATTALKYGGKKLAPGDAFTARRAWARSFVAIKKATYAPDVPPNAPENSPREAAPPDTPPSDLSPAATYETADMEAEPVTTETVQTKRTYRTRRLAPKG